MPLPELPPREHFLFQSPIHIRWADIDALQHVNNAVYLSYFEQARIDYFREIVGWNWQQLGMILASNEIHYLHPLFPTDQATIWMRTSRLGNKSFEMEYLVIRQKNETEEIITQAKAVLVSFDYHNNITIPMPLDYQQSIRQFEKFL